MNMPAKRPSQRAIIKGRKRGSGRRTHKKVRGWKTEPRAKAPATTQYRHPIRYSQANLDDAKTNLSKLKTAAQNVRYRLEDAGEGALETSVQTKVEALVAKFKVAMDDDFNTQNGITVVYELARELNVYAAREEVNRATLEYLLQNFATLVEIFGIEFENEELGDEKIEALIKKRDEARANRDFATDRKSVV